MSKTIRLFAAAAITVAMLPSAAAEASPPTTFEIDDWIVLFPDLDTKKAVFVNITARDFCEWVQDPTGPPPAIEPVTATVHDTGQGAVVGSVMGDLHIELWEFDEDPSPLIGPCEDIAEQLADPEAQPFASGTVSYTARSNNAFEAPDRANSGGDGGHAMLTDGANDYRYSWTFHVNDRCQLRPHGDHFDPACLVQKGRLKAI